MRRFYIRFYYLLVQLLSHWEGFLKRIVSKLARRYLFENRALSEYISTINIGYWRQKEEFVRGSENKKRVFFVFRGAHFIDWFTPIHRSLETLFPGRYQVFYINYTETLKRLRLEVERLEMNKQIDGRLLRCGISPIHHFSAEETRMLENFPNPHLIATTEGIRHEDFQSDYRVFIPHGCVVKEDRIQTNIRYNHFFLPAKSPYTYKELHFDGNRDFEIHAVGYPKLHSEIQGIEPLFRDNKPVVIFAPSLDIKLLLDFVAQGLIAVISRMTHVNFLIKLHPSFGSTNHYIRELFRHQIKNLPHIKLDLHTNIQDCAEYSQLLITDFGGVGAEYRLGFGKRVIYLKLPEDFQSGSDLIFRDHFADGIAAVENLESAITAMLKKGDLTEQERQKMGNRVLYHFDSADEEAAKAIDRILGDCKK